MPINVTCPTCNAELPAPDEYAGQAIRCAGCQGIVNVPAADAPRPTARPVARAVARPIAAAPSPPVLDDTPVRRKPKEEWDDDTPDDDDRDRDTADRPTGLLGGTAMVWMVFVGGLSLVGFGVLAYAAMPAGSKMPAGAPVAAAGGGNPFAPVPPPPPQPLPVFPGRRPVDGGAAGAVPPPANPGFQFPTVKMSGAATTAGLVGKYRDRVVLEADTHYEGQWPVTNAFDGVETTTWFNAPRQVSPWIKVTFPEDVTVSIVRIRGNRDPMWPGYDIREGQIEFLDAAGAVLFTKTATFAGKDATFAPDQPTAKVRAVRFTSVKESDFARASAVGEFVVE